MQADVAKAKKALTPDTINFKHPYSYDTPLHCAAASSFVKRKGVVEMLYRKGANLNDKNKVSAQVVVQSSRYLLCTLHWSAYMLEEDPFQFLKACNSILLSILKAKGGIDSFYQKN